MDNINRLMVNFQERSAVVPFEEDEIEDLSSFCKHLQEIDQVPDKLTCNSSTANLYSICYSLFDAPEDVEQRIIPMHLTFLGKLFEICSRGELRDIIRWSDDGFSWAIVSESRFESHVLPLYFGTEDDPTSASLTTFYVKLIIYGFRSYERSDNSKIIFFQHDMFQRGRVDLARNIPVFDYNILPHHVEQIADYVATSYYYKMKSRSNYMMDYLLFG